MTDRSVPISAFAAPVRSPQWYFTPAISAPPTLNLDSAVAVAAKTPYDAVFAAWRAATDAKPAPDYSILEAAVLKEAEKIVAAAAAAEVARTHTYVLAQLEAWAKLTAAAYIPLQLTDERLFEAQITINKSLIHLDFKAGEWYIVSPDGVHIHTPRGSRKTIQTLRDALQNEYRKIDPRFHVINGRDGQLLLSLFDRAVY